jgi:hypothetical protein
MMAKPLINLFSLLDLGRLSGTFQEVPGRRTHGLDQMVFKLCRRASFTHVCGTRMGITSTKPSMLK